MKKKGMKLSLIVFSACAALLMMPGTVDAASIKTCTGPDGSVVHTYSECPDDFDTTGSDVYDIARNVTNVATILVGMICTLVIIIAGIQYILSLGDPTKAATARKAILYSVIGLLLAIFAGVVVNFILDQLGKGLK